MGKYPFVYKLTTFDVYNLEKIECGIIYANSYAQAIGQIEDYYGEEILIVETLFAMDVGPVIIDEEIMHKLIKGEYEGYGKM
jgi:hypothetical protein